MGAEARTRLRGNAKVRAQKGRDSKKITRLNCVGGGRASQALPLGQGAAGTGSAEGDERVGSSSLAKLGRPPKEIERTSSRIVPEKLLQDWKNMRESSLFKQSASEA